MTVCGELFWKFFLRTTHIISLFYVIDNLSGDEDNLSSPWLAFWKYFSESKTC